MQLVRDSLSCFSHWALHPSRLFGNGAGPLMGQIAKPDRNVDNTTIWFDEGYTPAHYAQLYFDHTPGANSVTNYYEQQSSGRFNFDGSITNWTTVAMLCRVLGGPSYSFTAHGPEEFDKHGADEIRTNAVLVKAAGIAPGGP